MLFTNSRSVVKKNPVMPMITTRPQVSMMPKMQMNVASPSPTQANATATETPKPVSRKSIWGPAIWFFFHASAEKLKPEFFSTTGKELLNHIITVCNNLPCPECTGHASAYMKQINVNNIRTKDDLVQMLFVFHNQVNKRLGHPEFAYSDLKPKYQSANLINVYNNFIVYFNDKHYSIRMIAEEMFRARLCKQMTAWMQSNINAFDV